MAAAAMTVLSCGGPPTEIVVRVRASGAVAGFVTSVRVGVAYENRPPGHERVFTMGAGQPALPQDLAVLPAGGDTATAVLVTVTAYGLADTVLVTQHARVHFDPGHIGLLEVPIVDLCQATTCAPGFCLADGSCHAVDMETTRADDITPPM